MLTPLLDWCRARGLPPLPIIVVRRADGLPSGGYDPATVVAATEAVFAHPWPETAPPDAAALAAHALPDLPRGLRATSASGDAPC